MSPPWREDPEVGLRTCRCPECGEDTATLLGANPETLDYHCQNSKCGHSFEVSRDAIESLSRVASQPDGPVTLDTSLPLEDFLTLDLPPRPWIVEGLLQRQDTAMIHSFRGVGKSRFVQGLGCAVAAGEPFLRYVCPEPRGVLLVDGELPAEELQAMLAAQVSSLEGEPPARFKVLLSGLRDEPLGSLATAEGQAQVEACLDGIDLLILDNLSTLFRGSGPENDAESWEPAQDWLLRLRHQGLTVLLVHHEGKTGRQRGTSKREDVLSQVIQLRHPANYSPAEGCRFEVHFTKARGVYGEAATPFEAQFRTDDRHRAAWSWCPLASDRKERILDLVRRGIVTQRALAAELGVSLSSVNRTIRELRTEGRWPEAQP